MCFTVNVNIVKDELENRYGAKLIDPENYKPSYYYHAYSLPDLPVICSENREFIEIMKWGLIPSWVKDNEKAEEIRYKTFNARAETIDIKPSFSDSFISKRCIVPVCGFFEWQHIDGRKIPWYIYRADEDIMSLAGLSAEWINNTTGKTVKTFTIITTEANELMAEIHNTKKRMPLIIERCDEDMWLDTKLPRERIYRLLAHSPSEILKAHTISNIIARRDSEKNTPEIIKPFLYNNNYQK